MTDDTDRRGSPPTHAVTEAIGYRPPTSLPGTARVPAIADRSPSPAARRRRRIAMRSVLALLLAAGAGLGALARRPLPPAPVGPPPSWHLDVRTGGGAPWVLVYGREAGVHLVRASEVGRVAALPARVPGREVRLVSLGWSPLTVRGDAGGAGGVRAFSARARVVTVFQDGRGTGVRTGF